MRRDCFPINTQGSEDVASSTSQRKLDVVNQAAPTILLHRTLLQHQVRGALLQGILPESAG